MPKAKYDVPVRYEFELPDRAEVLPVSLILDGELIQDNLKEAGVDEAWLRSKLAEQGIARYKEVFYAEWNGTDNLYVALYETRGPA
jgi:uncharacterized membrane protein YcaP (DUF421 family)